MTVFKSTTFSAAVNRMPASQISDEAGKDWAAQDLLWEPYLHFKTREEYIAWRKEWKEANNDLIARIRSTKAELHKPHDSGAGSLMWDLRRNKHLSTAMRYLRMASKRKAGGLRKTRFDELAKASLVA